MAMEEVTSWRKNGGREREGVGMVERGMKVERKEGR